MQKDVFMEQLVKRKMMPFDLLINALIIIAAIVAVVVILGPVSSLLPGYGSIMLLASIAVIFGAFYLIYNKNVEFEYIFTNGELDVDTIIAKKRRKRLVTVSCKNVTAAGEYKPGNSQEASCAKVINATSGSNAETWFLVFAHRTFGKTMLIFEPNAELLENIKNALPRELVQNVFGRG